MMRRRKNDDKLILAKLWPINKRMKITLFLFLVLFMIAFVFLIFRIAYIDTTKGDQYKKRVLSQRAYTNSQLNFRRGSIKDRNETILAQSVRKYNLILEPRTLLSTEVTDEGIDPKEVSIDAIVKYLPRAEVSESELREKINTTLDEHSNSMYQSIDELKELSEEEIADLQAEMEKNKNITGFWFEETYKRNYPLKTIGCNIVGFTSSENQGTYGVEGSYNSQLNGKPGREYGYFDENMNFKRTIKKATNGNSVVLTIDANVQRVIENMIKKFNKDTGAKNIAVMVMDPNNGEILAQASQNCYDLNDPQNLKYMFSKEEIKNMDEKTKSEKLLETWSNFCVASAYEPGSTFKPFTIAAALDEGVISKNDYFSCGGVTTVAGVGIHCANRSGHGTLSLEESLNKSCNCALMAIGAKLGRNRFSKYNKIFGFGQKTGVDLPGETKGLIHTKEELNPVELATSSFGQTQTVTMMQMCAGFSSLINDGNYYQPHIVKEIQNDEGEVVQSIDPVVVKKTVSASTSKLLRKYLKSTVEVGTASPAQVPGYSIGGKTGTAEKRTQTAPNYLVSFLGCVPAMNPKAVVYVIIDEPHVEDQAHSTYATEFASKIMKKILPFLGIYGNGDELLASASPAPRNDAAAPQAPTQTQAKTKTKTETEATDEKSDESDNADASKTDEGDNADAGNSDESSDNSDESAE